MRLPTSAWSTMPCSPPTTLVSMVGHASFHTAGSSGPSIIERSYFRRPGLVSVSAGAIGVAGAAAVTSVNASHRAPSSDNGVDTPWTGTGEHEIKKEKTIKNGWRAPVYCRPERHREAYLKVRNSHFAGQHKRNRSRQQSKRKRRSQVCLQNAGKMKLPHRRHRQVGGAAGRKWRKTKYLHGAGDEEHQSRHNAQDAQHLRRPHRSGWCEYRHWSFPILRSGRE